MSIAGNTRVAIATYDVNKIDELEKKFAKLVEDETFKHLGWKYGYASTTEPAKVAVIEVPDNLNFWFQLEIVPRLLIPNFWEKTPEEVEAERMKLVAGDAWVLENWRKLAVEVEGIIRVDESYDSTASGEYAYVVCYDRPNPAKVTIVSGKQPDHAKALRHQIESVKALAAKLRFRRGPKGQKVKNVEINKDSYWGMFE